jgi:hypothetical protein
VNVTTRDALLAGFVVVVHVTTMLAPFNVYEVPGHVVEYT